MVEGDHLFIPTLTCCVVGPVPVYLVRRKERWRDEIGNQDGIGYSSIGCLGLLEEDLDFRSTKKEGERENIGRPLRAACESRRDGWIDTSIEVIINALSGGINLVITKLPSNLNLPDKHTMHVVCATAYICALVLVSVCFSYPYLSIHCLSGYPKWARWHLCIHVQQIHWYDCQVDERSSPTREGISIYPSAHLSQNAEISVVVVIFNQLVSVSCVVPFSSLLSFVGTRGISDDEPLFLSHESITEFLSREEMMTIVIIEDLLFSLPLIQPHEKRKREDSKDVTWSCVGPGVSSLRFCLKEKETTSHQKWEAENEEERFYYPKCLFRRMSYHWQRGGITDCRVIVFLILLCRREKCRRRQWHFLLSSSIGKTMSVHPHREMNWLHRMSGERQTETNYKMEMAMQFKEALIFPIGMTCVRGMGLWDDGDVCLLFQSVRQEVYHQKSLM